MTELFEERKHVQRYSNIDVVEYLTKKHGKRYAEYLVIRFLKTHFCLLLRKAASAHPTGRLARGLKPPAFSRILFQLTVQSASFYATSFQLVVVYFVHGCRTGQHINVPAIFKRLQFAKAKRAECPKDFLKKRITCTRAMALMYVR